MSFFSILINNLCCWLDDLIIKLDILSFKINRKVKEIENRNNEK